MLSRPCPEPGKNLNHRVRQEALKEVLADKIEEDPKFAEELSKLVEDIQKDKASISTSFIQNNQQVETQTNIGNVQGSVNIGSK